MAETDVMSSGVSALVEELSGASRRRRQEVAHKLALVAKKDPSLLHPHVDALVDALFRPEAQTRWEVLVALTALAEKDADKVADAFEGADEVYVVTLSAALSGSYNSAVLGRNLLLENKPEKKIHVFDSCSASVGETLIALKIEECEQAGMEFEETVETVNKYIESQNTYFVLENLETLRKNGRLSNLKAFVASALKIKPVMGSTPEGTIAQLDQARGINKALVKMVDYVAKGAVDSKNKVLGITHCNCPARAEIVKDAILKRIPVKDVVLLDTAGVSTMYANDGGIIVVI